MVVLCRLRRPSAIQSRPLSEASRLACCLSTTFRFISVPPRLLPFYELPVYLCPASPSAFLRPSVLSLSRLACCPLKKCTTLNPIYMRSPNYHPACLLAIIKRSPVFPTLHSPLPTLHSPFILRSFSEGGLPIPLYSLNLPHATPQIPISLKR